VKKLEKKKLKLSSIALKQLDDRALKTVIGAGNKPPSGAYCPQ
jgi:hypothetical protein